MAKFFIDRPIFAWVVAIFIIILGAFSATRLAVEQYPNIAAPTININFAYTGASAKTIQESVISVIEEQMNTLEGLDYMESQAYSSGTGSIALTFQSGMDEDIAQVNVQNKLSQVEARIPQVVRNTGITVEQSQSSILLLAALFAEEGSNKSELEIADYAIRNVKPILQRIEGVGNVNVFASEQAMRIWVDPQKLRSYNLSFADVSAAVQTQNTQITAGSLGDLPAIDAQSYTASIDIYGQLADPEEFGNIVLRSNTDGSTVRIKDVATVSIGQQDYTKISRLDGKKAVAIAVSLSTTGNAVKVANLINKELTEASRYFPEGIGWKIPYDTSKFVKISISQVIHTLFEAIFLVFVVMYLFLQNIRYTIIPTIVVPISLLGAVAVMYPLGLSINVLTMFAMVLVIGIVVDDAIVVVENVERLMAEEKLTPYQAAKKSMDQITGAVIGITLVLVTVFLPMAFLTGATGAIYRQFSLVMATAIAFSAFMALSLTPALCATLLKPIKEDHHEKKGFFGWFNRSVKSATHAYEGRLVRLMRFAWGMMAVFAVLVVITLQIYRHIPTSFLPTEDQGAVMVSYQLPSGATLERTQEVIKQAENIIIPNPLIENMVAIGGFSFFGSGQNMAMSFLQLQDWKERKKPDQSADAIIGQLAKQLSQITQAVIFPLNPPAIPSLGVSSGFDFWLQDRNNAGREALLAARGQFLASARQSKILSGVRPNGLEDASQIFLTIDRNAMFAQGVSFSALSSTLGTAIGSAYVNDFPNKGRMQRVYVMAQPESRMQPEDIMNLTAINNQGTLVPLSTFLTASWSKGAEQMSRYNGYSALKISGSAAEGYSTGEAMTEVLKIMETLPKGFAIEWTGQSLEEVRAGNSELYIYAFSALAVFLCLAALYESWSIPFSVILVVPLGILGVSLGNYFRGYDNDIYFKVGMITVMGLSAKNAILIIEFAKDLQEQGMSKVQAALQAAHLRFRPIIMTSLAFIIGVVPLYFASGAGSASQRAIGTSVFWGMLIGTCLATIFVPIFYVVVRTIFGGGKRVYDKYATQQEEEQND